MNSNDKQLIGLLFNKYLQLYAAGKSCLAKNLSEDFSGFSCADTALAKSPEQWLAGDPQRAPLHIQLDDLTLQALSNTVVVASGVFTATAISAEQTVPAQTARLVLVFRKELSDWKIAHSSMSTPNKLLASDELDSWQALTERNRALEKHVVEQASELSVVKDKLQATDKKLAQTIVEHQQAEEALRESESHFRMITESVVDVVWKLDSDYRFTYISPSDEKQRGYRADEVIGHHVFEMFDEEGIATIQRAARRRRESERKGVPLTDVTFEARHRCKDGSWIWGEICYNPEFDEHGNVIGFYGISREITERKKMQEQVCQLAFYDPLTQLPNRHLLNERLNQALAVSKRKGLYGALMFLDLDNFKPINDAHGHVAGDMLLVEVAQRLKASVREVDTVARFGGDEFIVVLGELSADEQQSYRDAQRIAEKIRSALAASYQLTGRLQTLSATPNAFVLHSY